LAGIWTILINAQHVDTGRASVFHVSHELNNSQSFYGESAMCRVAGHDATNLFMNLE
jgi:hypothetical protein